MKDEIIARFGEDGKEEQARKLADELVKMIGRDKAIDIIKKVSKEEAKRASLPAASLPRKGENKKYGGDKNGRNGE